jgi:outer membrane biosynthesis protein TonB
MRSILGFLAGISIVLILSLVYVEVTSPDADDVPTTTGGATFRQPDTLRAAPVAAQPSTPAPQTSVPMQSTPVAVQPKPEPIQPTPVTRAVSTPPVSEPVPEGPVRTNDDIERQARAHRTSIDGCHTIAVATNPRASGTIAVRVTISARGSVTAFQITTDSVNDRDFALCLEDEIRSWRFGQAANEYTGSYSFTFSR